MMKTIVHRLLERLREERGQTATEFALTVPMVLMFAFVVMQAAIIFTIAHQTSYASFAAARHHRVAKHQGDHQEQQVVDAILNGAFYDAGRLAPSWHEENDGGGVRYQWNNLDTALPYANQLAGCKQYGDWRQLWHDGARRCSQYARWELPTHLGENTYVKGMNFDRQHGDRSSIQQRYTDNNIDDDKGSGNY